MYQAVWSNNMTFDEVLISPTMINDHMPDNVLDALHKVSGFQGQCRLTLIFRFITYLYKEQIRKNLECDNSQRLHYSLVFDLSPTLRQIASTLSFD